MTRFRPAKHSTIPSQQRAWAVGLVALASAGGHGIAHAQDAATPRGGSGFAPTLAISETYLTGTGVVDGVSRNGEFITRLSPGFNWSSRSGRLQGAVSYSLDASYYSKRPDSTEINNALNANLQLEAIEKWAFIDALANISQRSISAYGQQSFGDTLQANSNRAEVSNFSLSPYVRGNLGGAVDYQVRYTAAATQSDDFIASRSQSQSALVSLRSTASLRRFGWGLTGQRQRVDFKNGRATDNDRVNADLTFKPDTDLLLGVNGGQEATDVGGVSRRTYDNWGWSLRWTPSPRTNVQVQSDRRYFGNSHNIVFEYRTPRTVWRYSDSRAATSGSDSFGGGQPITLYQLYFDVLASQQPDPVLREQLVREFLRQQGLDPNLSIPGGFLTSTVSVQRRQDLSVAWAGLRTTINLLAYATALRSLDNAANPGAAPPPGEIKQSGVTASLAYRLTPQIGLTGSASRQVTPSNGAQSGNTLNSFSFGLSNELGRYINLSLTARYTEFDSLIDPYRESAITASLNFRF